MQLGPHLRQFPRRVIGLAAELRRRRAWWPGAAALAVGAFCVLALMVFAADRVSSSSTVLRGVWAGQVALSGLDQASAKRALAPVKERLEAGPARVSVASRIFEVEPEKLGLKLDVEATLQRAMQQGRAGGLLSQFGWWIRRWTDGASVPLVVRVDPAKLEEQVKSWEVLAIADPPVPGGLVMEELEPVAVKPTEGQRVDREGARRALQERAVDFGLVVLPVRTVKPELSSQNLQDAVSEARQLVSAEVVLRNTEEELKVRFSRDELARMLRSRPFEDRLQLYFDERAVSDQLDRLRASIVSPPVDARFVIKGPEDIEIEPSKTGTRLDDAETAEELLKAAKSDAREGRLPVYRDAEPSLTEEDARALNIRGLVSQFTTKHPCCRPRVKNIHRIAELLDGVVVKPGETFSINDYIGPRTEQKGFVPAPSIEDGEMVDTVGGGISQFATTFFNAVFHGGYDIVERQPHSYWFSRYPMGHEATLSWPKPDLVFRNDTKSGVLIKTRTTGTRVTVLLYGDNEGREVRADVSDRHHIVEPPVELVPNPELAPDREKAVERGTAGWTVDVSRTVVFSDGTKKTEKRRVIYSPRPRRVEVHPCRIPKGEPGHTGELCPIPESALLEHEAATEGELEDDSLVEQ